MEHYLIKVIFYNVINGTGFYENNRKKYTYKVPKDVHLDVGDEVVVFVTGVADQKHHVVRVVNIDLDGRDTEFAYKWIVEKIDTVSYDERVAKDNEFKALVHKLMNRKKNKSLVEQLAEVATDEELEKLKKLL